MQLFQTTSSFFNCFFAFFFGSHAKWRCTYEKRQRSRLQRSEKHICQSETKFYYMKLHLSLKYPQNVEMFQLFHFRPNGKTKNEKLGSVRFKTKDRTQTYSETIICVSSAIRHCVCVRACYFIHWFEVCNFWNGTRAHQYLDDDDDENLFLLYATFLTNIYAITSMLPWSPHSIIVLIWMIFFDIWPWTAVHQVTLYHTYLHMKYVLFVSQLKNEIAHKEKHLII